MQRTAEGGRKSWRHLKRLKARRKRRRKALVCGQQDHSARGCWGGRSEQAQSDPPPPSPRPGRAEQRGAAGAEHPAVPVGAVPGHGGRADPVAGRLHPGAHRHVHRPVPREIRPHAPPGHGEPGGGHTPGYGEGGGSPAAALTPPARCRVRMCTEGSWMNSTCRHRRNSPRSRARGGLGVQTPKTASLPGRCIDIPRGGSRQCRGQGSAGRGLTPVPVLSPAGTEEPPPPRQDTRCPGAARSR